jgi:HAE1 family hydrophobic/amphiphilic exporter-1
LSAEQKMASLRPQLSRIPGLRVFISNPPPISIGGLNTRSQYQFTLQDTDTDELYRWAPILEDKVRQLPGLEDVSSDLQVKNPQIQIDMDRDKISALGLTVNQVETALYNAYGTRQVSQIYAPNNQYQVVPQVASNSRKIRQRCRCYASLHWRRLIPLNTVAKVTTTSDPRHLPPAAAVVTISFNLKPGFALGDA